MEGLMDDLTRYTELDTTKDPTSDDEKAGKGKKNDGGKGRQKIFGYNGNHGNGGKRKHLEGSSNLLANTNIGNNA